MLPSMGGVYDHGGILAVSGQRWLLFAPGTGGWTSLDGSGSLVRASCSTEKLPWLGHCLLTACEPLLLTASLSLSFRDAVTPAATARSFTVHVIYYGSTPAVLEELSRLADAVFQDVGPKWNLLSRFVTS